MCVILSSNEFKFIEFRYISKMREHLKGLVDEREFKEYKLLGSRFRCAKNKGTKNSRAQIWKE